MKNKKIKLLSLAAVLLQLGGASAFAAVIGGSGVGTNTSGTYTNGASGTTNGGGGGEFLFNATSGPVSNSSYDPKAKNVNVTGSFQTFCLEVSQNLGTPVDYAVNNGAVSGGTNTHAPNTTALGASGDIISVGTAYLYSQFAKGVLASYDYNTTTSARKADAALLQAAIWALEDEIADFAEGANAYFDLAVSQFTGATWAIKKENAQANNATGGYGVYVLNNTQSGGTVQKQDMLYYTTGADVPDGGATIMLLGLALGGLSVARRYLKA